MNRVTAEIQIQDGPLMEVTYSYLVLIDGGEYHLVAWDPEDMQIVLNCPTSSESEAGVLVRREAMDALNLMVRANMRVRCINCD
jgi:hypothetical protein